MDFNGSSNDLPAPLISSCRNSVCIRSSSFLRYLLSMLYRTDSSFAASTSISSFVRFSVNASSSTFSMPL